MVIKINYLSNLFFTKNVFFYTNFSNFQCGNLIGWDRVKKKKCKNCEEDYAEASNSRYFKDCKKLRKHLSNEERRKRH